MKTTHELLPAEQVILDELLSRRPDLTSCTEALIQLHDILARAYDAGRKLLLCGNGGSNADAMHIAGELCKSFERKRPLPAEMATRLAVLPHGKELAQYLEEGLPAIALGFNGSLKTAIENDSPLRDIAFAQELYALAKPGDVLIAFSTSGNANNCIMAMSTAKAIGVYTIAMTGPSGGKMADLADLSLRAPGASTKVIQEAHIALYHAFCAMIEVHYFPDKR